MRTFCFRLTRAALEGGLGDREVAGHHKFVVHPSRLIVLNGTKAECIVGLMGDYRKTTVPTPDIPEFPKDWREQIKADLAFQLEAGGTLYGVRVDGAYVARTSDGDRVLGRPDQESA